MRKMVPSIRRRRTGFTTAASSFPFSLKLYCVAMSILMFLGPVSIRRIRADWIDPDTPDDAKTATRYSTRLPPMPPTPAPSPKPARHKRTKRNATSSPRPTTSPQPSRSPSASPSEYPTFSPTKSYELVFSDEFNVPSRSFEDGTDPRWTALDKNDYTNGAFHYYTPRNAETRDGHLVITSEAADTEIIGFNDIKLKRVHDTKHFRSAMLQSWNKFCFTGGIVEAEVTLPGRPDVGGLWPAFWLLGNLARHTYVGSSEHIWPWSSSICTKKSGWAQKISGCDRVAHYGTTIGSGKCRRFALCASVCSLVRLPF